MIVAEFQTTDLEKTSLEAHVDLCALRYQNLDARLVTLETKLDQIQTKIDTFKDEIAWLLIKGGFGIIITLLGSIAAILKLFGHW
jgi:hypothetical protein